MRGDGGSGSLGLSNGRLVSARSEDEAGPTALGAIFAIERGRFDFSSGADAGGGDLDGELDEILDTALRERDRFVETRGIIPSDRMRFRLSERAAERQQIRVSPEEWKALLAIDGERDAAAIALQLGVGRITALEALAKLAKAGFIDPFTVEGADSGAAAAVEPLEPTAAGEHVDLRGSIDEFPLDTVLELLVGLRKTGRLDVRSPSGDARLGITGGRLIAAGWDEETGELALGAAFTLDRGEFDFVPNEVTQHDLTGELEELVTRAVETRDRILAVRAVIPAGPARFRLSDRATRQPEVTLSPEQWRTLLAVNGERDVAAIAEHLRMRRMQTMMVLAELIQLGLVDAVGPGQPIREIPPPPPTWEAPVAAPEPFVAGAPPEPVAEVPVVETPPSWGPSVPTAPADTTWAPPPEESAAPPVPERTPEPEPALDPRLAAFGFGAPAAPPPVEEEAPEPVAETPPAPEIDPRLAAFGYGAPTAPAWEPAPPEPAAAEPTWTTPVEPTPTIEPPPPVVERDATEIVVDLSAMGVEPVAAEPRAAPAAPPPAAVEAPEKKKGLLGGLFGRAETAPAPAVAPAAAPSAAGARTRAGALAVFVNELLGAYNSGKYGKGHVADRMLDLLMRVDEQADPIDRPVPVRSDRLDVTSIDDQAIPERQALPYLAMLVRQVYDDAERALGKDKAKKGFRDVRDRLFGKDLSLLQAPEVAGRVPKV